MRINPTIVDAAAGCTRSHQGDSEEDDDQQHSCWSAFHVAAENSCRTVVASHQC